MPATFNRQAAMGWNNSHLDEIRAGDVGFSTPDPDADWIEDFFDTRKTRLDDVLADIAIKKRTFLYECCDGSQHSIIIEPLADLEPGALYPRAIELRGRSPPEECGWPFGYADLLEAIADPKQERHVELAAWIGDDPKSQADGAEALIAEVATLTKS